MANDASAETVELPPVPPPPSDKGANRDTRDRNSPSLHVKGVTPETKPEDLREAFTRYGKVKDVYIPKDYYTGRPRGFAFIQYENAEDTETAFNKIDYVTVNGAKLTCQIAAGDRKGPSEMRYRDKGTTSGGGRGDRRDRSPPRRRDRYDDRRGYDDRRDRRGGRYDDRDRDYRDDRGRDRSRERDRYSSRRSSPSPPPRRRASPSPPPRSAPRSRASSRSPRRPE
ncbi:hypothetical protein SmJEL517_g04063 [Synchytrium microbalum]|uniref:RRM domain-containing protein n=1 Tax=Synchytrium microbalum TaxID=1806994 RepID=A0A507C603_9FUNG|nr:uncharacterized protein SmJEL517_g04063 [Synchytrium microbalum]TPX32905.1 hypothetical protein SmJEL517_g04063 [Synchytrium microbalum]